MKIAVIGHSMVAERQQFFFKKLASLGHQVLVVGPGEWGHLRAQAVEFPYPNNGVYQYVPRRHMGEDLYSFRLLNANEFIEPFDADWLYVQQEPGSLLAAEALQWDARHHAIFTWENIALKGDATDHLSQYDLVVCGNKEAVELTQAHARETALMLQVGVDTDHFNSRELERTINVGYVGRKEPEKGLPYLTQAWPTASIANWTPFLQLPWIYSQLKVLVAFSQDVPFWHEQAPNYTVLEALSCGCNVVISDTPAMSYWLKEYPGVYMVAGHKQIGPDLDLVRINNLKAGIHWALENYVEGAGRQMVIDRFSTGVLANQLVEAFLNAEGRSHGTEVD